MLLIGSVAARHHFPAFRRPRGDVDVIATRREATSLALRADEVLGESPGKFMASVGGTRVDVEIAERGGSAYELLPFSDGGADVPGLGTVPVASPEALLLLKASHVCFAPRWEKTFKDYKFLRERARIGLLLAPVLEERIAETTERLGFKDRDFDVTNEEFFAKSAHAVKRFLPHDDLHEVVSDGEVPAYKLMKDDLSRAAVSTEKFVALPFATKMRAMREEVMVLAMERYVLPAHADGEPYSERTACRRIMKGLCHNFLPFGLRMFAVENFYSVLRSVPEGFSLRVLARLHGSGVRVEARPD